MREVAVELRRAYRLLTTLIAGNSRCGEFILTFRQGKSSFHGFRPPRSSHALRTSAKA